ncbi:MAG: hypothetical protein AAF546_00145 [Verrucomicrobiota bacterium]
MNKNSRNKLETMRTQLESIKEIEEGEFDCLPSDLQDGQRGDDILDNIDALKDIDMHIGDILSR